MPAGTITPTQVQTDWLCNSGTVLTALPATTAWTLEQTIENYLVMKRVTLAGPMDGWDGFEHLAVGRVIRLDYRDASTTPATDDWEEYRVTDLVIDQATRTWTATGVWWIQDLLEKDALVSVTVNGAISFEDVDYAITPTAALTARVDAFLPGYWSINTVTPTAVIDVRYDHDTPLSAALRIAETASMVSGAVYELWPSRNGVSGVRLNLSAYGAGAFDARIGKNLFGIRTTKRRGEQSTRIAMSVDTPFRRPTYKVSAVSASAYIEVQEVNALGPGPAREADQWNNFYWIEEKNGTAHAITATSRQSYGTTRLSMASTTTIAVGDRGYLAANSSRDDFAYVDSPGLQATYGKRLGVLPGEPSGSQVIRNCDFRDSATDWSTTGSPTATTTAGLWRTGGRSYHLPGPSQSATQTQSVYLLAGTTVTYAVTMLLVAASSDNPGTSQLELWNPEIGAFQNYYLLSASGSGIAVEPEFDVNGGTWVRFVRSFTVTTTGVKSIGVRLTIGVYVREVYLDQAQCFIGATSDLGTTRIGSGAADNIALANAHLDTNGDPIATYDVEVADLALLDPRTYGDDRPGLGSTCYLTDDADLDREALRIVAMTVDSRRPLTPRLQLSNRPRRLTSLLVS